MPQSLKQRARALFMDVADLAGAERETALARLCAGNAALRAEVEALLRADRAAGAFLSHPTGADVDVAPAATEQAGASIGRYKLLEQIGEGGMGTIWMAEQREPVKRRVALKIIKLGMDTKQVIARFEAERQALAMMDHPHIAKVLDAGATETGRPYFVMEYIKGIPILEYCDQEKVDTKARLELFTSVCHAIQHAHQKGIIHRDIKPSNVLVTLHDGVPVCKVIDFGIAKATNAELTTKTLFTEHRQMVGTPAYMSPEQAEMSGLDIDTRSDIYSLGVLLYELLTGTTPFDMQELLAKGFAEMMRTIREDEPHKPSTRISSLGDTGTRTALQRKVDLKKLGSLLRGDLDWIVMKCLEKDRARRYDTANGLAADIKRHLHDEPVSAGAPSSAYKLRKFAKRNRVHVIAGGAVVAALLIGVIAFAWQARVASDQRDLAVMARESEAEQHKLADAARAEAQTQEAKAKEQEGEARKQAAEARTQEAEARKQAAIAEAVARFQTEMLAAADPQNLLGDKVTVVQAMEAAVKELDQGSLKDQPLVEAGVRATIGNTLRGLARYDDAEPNLRKSLAILRAALPAGHPDIAVGLMHLARLLSDQNELAAAELLVREALEIWRAALPAGHHLIAVGLNGLAILMQAQDKFAESEPLFREVLAIRRAAFPAGHSDVAMSLNNLAALLQARGKLAEAEPLFREALGIRRATYPAGHPEIAAGLHNLACLLQAQNKLAEAEPLYREALEIDRAALPAGHPNLLVAIRNLGNLYAAQERTDEALPLLREVLAASREWLPKDSPELAAELATFGQTLLGLKQWDEAEPLLREGLAIRRAALLAGHPDIAASLNSLASLLQDQNKFAEAEPLYREALEIRRAALPAGHRDINTSLNDLATLLQAENRFAEAEPLYREVLEIRRAKLPAGHPDIATSLNNLSTLLRAQNRLAEAEPLCREALAIYRAAVPAGHPKLRAAQSNLADLCTIQGRAEQAVPLLRELLVASRARLPKDSPALAGQLATLSQTLLGLKQWAEAEPLIRECLAIREKIQPDAWTTFNSRSLLGAALLGQKMFAEAEPLLLAGYRGMKEREATIEPGGSTRIPEALARLVQLYEATGNTSEAAAWRSKLEATRAASGNPATDGNKR